MIIDYQTDAAHAELYDVVNAGTLEDLTKAMRIFYADDAAGIVRHYLRDTFGNPYWWTKDGHYQVYFDWPKRPSSRQVPFARLPGNEVEERTENDIEIAWEEIQRPIRILRKSEAKS